MGDYWSPSRKLSRQSKQYGVVAGGLLDDWQAWRVIQAGLATMNELRTVYDYEDLLMFNAALNMKEDIEAIETEDAKRQSKRGAS